MPKVVQPKKVPGLYLRPDGLYEKIIKIDGKRVYFRAKDPKQVYQKIASYEEKKETGAYFIDIAELWETEHFPTLTHNTKMGYMPAYKRVKSYFGEMPVKNILPQDINNYIINFSKNRAYKTTANELLVLRMILDFACLKNEIQSNPSLHVKVPKGLSREPRRFPTDKEIQTVKDSIDKDYGLLYYFVLYSGARLGEALALQWKDIDFDNKQINISKSVYYVSNQPQIKTPKTVSGKRNVILLDRLATVLKEQDSQQDEYVFSEDGRLPSRTMVHRGKKRYKKQTGIDISPHQLRHAFATMLFEAGIDEKTAQYLLGHAQISTTMDIYTELRKQKLIEAAQKLEDFDINTVNTQ